MAIDLSKLSLDTEGGSPESNRLLDTLLKMEDVLDSMDIYCFPHWMDGEIIEGPLIRRYFASFTLLYSHNKMPDPRGALRLLKHDVVVEYNKVQQNGEEFHALSDDKTKPEDSQDKEKKYEADPNHQFWMVKVTFPRRLLDEIGTDLEFYDDEVDMDDVESAKDSGLDDESAYKTDEQGGSAGAAPGDEDEQGQGVGNPFETETNG